jgi:short-subunit dehydrogenase
LLQDFVNTHPGSVALPLDVTDAQALHQAVRSLQVLGSIDMVVYCAGYYTAQTANAYDVHSMQTHLSVNYTGALLMLDAVLPVLLAQGQGHISLVSSVAGFTGLPNSLAYGPTKAALINLAEALYMDVHDAGLGVSVVNPGFVETPLTAQNTFKMPGLISPEQAALDTLAGWAKGEFEIHYPKSFTRWMKLLRLLPYRWYFPLVKKMTGL